MKIIQIITIGSELYGAQRHVIDLCVRLQSEGHEVVLLLGSAGKMSLYAESLGINTIILKHLKRTIHPYHDISGVVELVHLFREIKPDVVASHSSKAGILARIAAWWLDIPNTFTAHGWSFAEGIPLINRKMFQWIEKIIGLLSCKIITVSEADKNYALQLGVVSAKKMEVIHYGINPPVPIQRFSIVADKPLVMVMPARFQAQKDHETLINALLPLKSLNWQLYLLGDGELMPSIREKVSYHGLSDKIFFEGAVNNVPDYLQKADLFLLITNWEGLPISILEAMSYKLPIIASDVAGVKEEVLNGVNGFLVPRKDSISITSAISTFYNNRVMLNSMGEKSWLHFQTHFTIDIMTQRTLGLYCQIANKK